jgi:LAO/AO transport system kinase
MFYIFDTVMPMQNTTFISDFKTLARTISLVENEADGFEVILEALTPRDTPVIGFTGPPGAGKSTLLNAVIGYLLDEGKKIGLVLVDPSSPFNLGAVLGDRLRMTAHFTDPNLFIRSLASRGSLGGLSDKIIEIVEVMKSYEFDYIFVETVGVGQSEVEIAGLADTTVVVLVPEGGDSIQAMKAGLMEIADIFVVNKSDRPDAEAMINFLSLQLHINRREYIPVLPTVAVEGKGIKELISAFSTITKSTQNQERKLTLLTDKAYKIIQRNKMRGFDKKTLHDNLLRAHQSAGFSLYRFTSKYLHSSGL